MSRSNFSYRDFVKDVIDSNQSPISPSSMVRAAIAAGARENGESLRKRLREACEGLAGGTGYKRKRIKGVSGYLYAKSLP